MNVSCIRHWHRPSSIWWRRRRLYMTFCLVCKWRELGAMFGKWTMNSWNTDAKFFVRVVDIVCVCVCVCDPVWSCHRFKFCFFLASFRAVVQFLLWTLKLSNVSRHMQNRRTDGTHTLTHSLVISFRLKRFALSIFAQTAARATLDRHWTGGCCLV